jgi:hypothetical protein
MKIKICLKMFISLLVLAFSPISFSSTEEYELDYDSIVADLQETRKTYAAKSIDPFDNVVIHAGIGLANAAFEFRTPSGRKILASPGGFQATLGIDLFSPNWIAEGVVRSFGESEFNGAIVGLQEFDLKLMYRKHIQTKFYTRFGLGLAGRYLDVRSAMNSAQQKKIADPDQSYRTPSSIFFVGIDQYLNSSLSIGAEVSSRRTVIDETADKSSFDITLRLDTHF